MLIVCLHLSYVLCNTDNLSIIDRLGKLWAIEFIIYSKQSDLLKYLFRK
jgi:hypothetical protein